MLTLPQFDVRALEVHRPHAVVRLSRPSGTAWVRDGAGQAPNAGSVDHLLSLLSNLRAEEFVLPQPKSFPAETTIDAEVRSGEAPAQPHRLELGGNCRARVDEIPVFTLAAKTCDDIARTVAAIH